MDVPVQIPQPMIEGDLVEIAASMSRHPAGKGRDLSRCPTCGQKASGALGESLEVSIDVLI